MRASTSLNQVKGSTPACSAQATKLCSTAAVLPPLSLPKNVQCLVPARCRESFFRYDCCRSPDFHLPCSASAPPSSSARIALPGPPDFSAAPQPESRANSYAIYPESAAIRVVAAAAVCSAFSPRARSSTLYNCAISSAGPMRA